MIEKFLTEILIAVFFGVVTTALKIWRDVHILKRDVDAIAEIIGTERALARKKNPKKRKAK